MPYKPIECFPPEERQTEIKRRRKLSRHAKRKSREFKKAAGMAPEKDTRTGRKRGQYQRNYRANKQNKD
mgnify:CR=1 FL=1